MSYEPLTYQATMSSSSSAATYTAVTEVKTQTPTMADHDHQPQPQTQTQTQTQTTLQSELQTAADIVASKSEAVNLRHQNHHPLPPAAKLPSRPRKLRKLSPETSVAATSSTTSAAVATTASSPSSSNKSNKTASFPRLIARSLSSEGEIEIALRHLRNSDPHLGRLIDLHQPPTFDSCQTPFLALTKSILYQQLAYKAGTSIYSRFVALCGGESGVVPETVLGLTPQQLRQIGVSGRKTSYLHDLARKYQNGILSDSSIINMDDKSLFTMLTMVNGIGSWSVHMFMIFSLHRPDVLPVNDLGVRKGFQLLYGLEDLPRPSQMDHLCEKWRPYRSVASWYLWRFVEAKGTPSTSAAVTAGGGMSSQQQMPALVPLQQQSQLQPQFIDPINGIMNLSSNFSQLS